MSEEQLKELQEYNLEYLEAQSSEEIFGGDYTSAVELKYAKKEIERLKIIEEKYKDSQLYIKDFKDEIERLQKDLIYYQEYSADLLNKNNTFENIIKEAIEYIEQVGIYSDYGDSGIQSENDLLKILKGE